MINDTDATRVSQIHAMRAAVQAHEAEIGSDNFEVGSLRGDRVDNIVAAGEVLWRWNETDLTQFDTRVDGRSVTAGDAQVVALSGLNWIRLDALTVGATSAVEAIVALPMADAAAKGGAFPNDYMITADFIGLDVGGANAHGAMLHVRFTEVDVAGTDRPEQSYWMRYNDGTTTPNTDMRYSETAGPSNPLITTHKLSEPSASVDAGTRLALGVQGTSFVRMSVGESVGARELVALYATGRPALGITTSAINSDNMAVAFRNIIVTSYPHSAW